jgi:signal transduction histidine kinase
MDECAWYTWVNSILMPKTKLFLVYALIAVLITIFIAAGYFHEFILTYFPFIPPYTLFIFSVLFSVIIIFYLWYKDQEIEKEKYEFVSIATHKFRTPLSGIKWAIEAMKKEQTHEERQEILDQLNNSTNRLIEIVDLLVDFAKIDTNLDFAYEAASLFEMVNDSIARFGREIGKKGIALKVEAAPRIPLIVIDKRKIQFVIDMLLDNAVKYSSVNGLVRIGIYTKGPALILAIEDSGIGMTRTTMSNLFKQFYRGDNARAAHTDGMGLGLYAAKRIIDRHGGKMWADSKGLGQGSTFYLSLKLNKNYTG